MPAPLLVVAVLQTATPVEYQWICEARVALTDQGSLGGSITVGEDGRLFDFSARAVPAETALDRAFSLHRFAGVGEEAHARWSIDWRDDGTLVAAPTLAFADGKLQLEIERRKAMPRLVTATLRRRDTDAAAVIAFSQRWPGRKTGAAFAFPLRYVLGMSEGRPAAEWTLYGAPIGTVYYSGRWLASGPLPLAGIRAAEPAFAAFRTALLARAADYRTACRREEKPPPAPDAEI